MKETDERIFFAGTKAFDQPRVPGWYHPDEFNSGTVPTFGEAFRSLITADTSEVSWKVPDSLGVDDPDELNEHSPGNIEFYEDSDGSIWATTTRHNAVFSPELLTGLASGEQNDPLLNVPTDSYGLVNPYEFYRPLEDALEDAGEGENVFGEFRLYDRGAEVHGDIWFDTKEIDIPDGSGKFKFGIQTGYGFKGNRALYANVIAQDTSCENSLRQLAQKKTRRHVSEDGQTSLNPEAYERWWADLLEKIDLVSDELNHILADAHDLYVTFEVENPVDGSLDGDAPLEVPFSLEEFYRLAGVSHIGAAIPEYIRDGAAQDARQRSGTQDTHSMWHVHSGLTYALTHSYRGGERGSLLRYNQVAKDLLYNPHEMMADVARQYEEEVRAQEDDDEDDAVEAKETGVATIHRSAERLEQMSEEYEDRQHRIETMLEDEEAAA